MRTPGIFLLFLFVAVIIPRTALRAGNPPHLYSLAECIEMALQNGPEFRSLENSRRISQLDYSAATSDRYPRINLNLTSPFNINRNEEEVFYSSLNRYQLIKRTDRRSNVSLSLAVDQTLPTNGQLSLSLAGNRSRFSSDIADNRNRLTGSARVEFSQPLFALNRYQLNRDKADLALSRAQQDARRQKNQLLMNLISDYYNIALQQKAVEIDSLLLKKNEASCQLIQSRYQQGRATELDMLNAEINLRNLELDLLRQNQQLEVLQDELKIRLGLPREEALRLSNDMKFEVYERSLAQTVGQALSTNPDLQMDGLSLASARLSRKEQNEQNRLQLSLFSNLDYNNQQEFYPTTANGQYYTWQMGLNFRLPVWDGGYASAASQALDLNMKNLRIAMDLRKRDIMEQVTQAYRSLDNQQKAYAIIEKKTEVAEKAWELSRIKYDTGYLPLQDYIDAQNNYRSALQERARAVIEYNKAVFQLRQMIGMDISK